MMFFPLFQLVEFNVVKTTSELYVVPMTYYAIANQKQNLSLSIYIYI